jgi:hypothetical protein
MSSLDFVAKLLLHSGQLLSGSLLVPYPSLHRRTELLLLLVALQIGRSEEYDSVIDTGALEHVVLSCALGVLISGDDCLSYVVAECLGSLGYRHELRL